MQPLGMLPMQISDHIAQGLGVARGSSVRQRLAATELLDQPATGHVCEDQILR